MVDRFGRKPVLVTSSTGVLVALVALGTYFYYDDHMEVVCPEIHEGMMTSSTTTAEPCDPKSGFDEDLVDSLSWLPLTSLFVFKYFHAFGLTSLPMVMCGEFFSSEAKDISSTLNGMFGNLCSFFVSRYQVDKKTGKKEFIFSAKFFPQVDLEDWLGTAGLYYFYGGFALVAIFYCAFVIPETKGRSAKDMKRLYSREPLYEDKEEESKSDTSSIGSNEKEFPATIT